ncbi:MAG: hypothetical protein Q8K26_04400, partial [Candidatus Gracilibacteria bacterium]|nr:hypothetical protein [Candidatus Gracilibacteria bacterium]
MLWTSVFAASPLDIFSKYLPDIAVTNAYQETRFIYMRVCSVGGALNSSENTLTLAIKRLDGRILSKTVPITWGAGSCDDFQVASIGELGITTSGRYHIAVGALIPGGRAEKTKDNNKITRTLDITYPSKYITPSTSTTYSNTNNSFLPYCTSANNYCNYYYNQNYNYGTTYYRNNICPVGDIACNNNYFNSANSSNGNVYCNSGNNYCNNYNYNYSNTYCNSSNNYCNNYNYNQDYNQNYNSYCNSSNNYCNNYNYNYNSNNNYYCNSSNNYCNNYNYNNSNSY